MIWSKQFFYQISLFNWNAFETCTLFCIDCIDQNDMAHSIFDTTRCHGGCIGHMHNIVTRYLNTTRQPIWHEPLGDAETAIAGALSQQLLRVGLPSYQLDHATGSLGICIYMKDCM